MNNLSTITSAARTMIASAAFLFAAGSLAACGSQQADPQPQAVAAAASTSTGGDACASSADAVERWAAAGASMPACKLEAQARSRAFVKEHCAVSADAAERRGARHPGHVCRV